MATTTDAALMMRLGMDGVFVGSGTFKSGNLEKRARAIVQAVAHFWVLAEVSSNLGPAMVGITHLQHNAVNFRDGGAGEGAAKKRVTTAKTKTYLSTPAGTPTRPSSSSVNPIHLIATFYS
ncbi:hypothetical protein EON64_00800 [archaeon]|nr:MAG: hypothetical protein EON64_00800 [archaeon]